MSADVTSVVAATGDRVLVFQVDVDRGRAATRISGAKVRPFPLVADAAPADVKAMAILPGDEALIYVAADGRGAGGGLRRVRAGGTAGEVIDAGGIARASGLGVQLALADVQMTTAGGAVWLVLRTPDLTAFCRLDVARLGDASPRLARPFDHLIDEAGRTLAVERLDVWTGRANGTLVLFRPASGQAWQVDGNGRATAMADLPAVEGRAAATVPPLILPATGDGSGGVRTVRFFPEPPRGTALPTDGVRYPILVVSDSRGDTVFDCDALQVRPGFPTHALRFTAWCADGPDVVAYDAMSGEVFRIAFGG